MPSQPGPGPLRDRRGPCLPPPSFFEPRPLASQSTRSLPCWAGAGATQQRILVRAVKRCCCVLANDPFPSNRRPLSGTFLTRPAGRTARAHWELLKCITTGLAQRPRMQAKRSHSSLERPGIFDYTHRLSEPSRLSRGEGASRVGRGGPSPVPREPVVHVWLIVPEMRFPSCPPSQAFGAFECEPIKGLPYQTLLMPSCRPGHYHTTAASPAAEVLLCSFAALGCP